MSIKSDLAEQHRACDAQFATIEQATYAGDWATVIEVTTAFIAATEAHFQLEENVLFPELENAAPNAANPILVMRGEHDEIRELLIDLDYAVQQRERRSVIDTSETLLLIMQQHNAKEESVLYPLADRALAHFDAIAAQQAGAH